MPERFQSTTVAENLVYVENGVRNWPNTFSDQNKPLHDCSFMEPAAIVFGNEHSGISPGLLSHCTEQIHIPQMGMGQSLNVSVACAVFLFEAFRQRYEAGMYDKTIPEGSELRALHNDWIKRHENRYRGRSMKRSD